MMEKLVLLQEGTPLNTFNKDIFRFVMPAELSKSEDGNWKIKGLASTEKMDAQGEIILQKGIDASPIDNKKGIINFDHQKGIENTIGFLDSYQKTDNGLFIQGRLFQHHAKAKAVAEIMQSLGKSDSGRVGLSVEGQILERDSKNPKIIKKCRISAVAVTLNPVNQDTYADLMKSMSTSEVEFDSIEQPQSAETNDTAVFTADQVVAIIQKALSIGQNYGATPPGNLTGGSALGTEELKKKKKKLKPMEKSLYKSAMLEILDNLQKLYPDNTRSEIWEAVKDRLDQKFPSINQKD